MVFLEAFCALFVIIGVTLQVIPKIECWYFMIIAQVGWIVYACITQQYWWLLQAVVLLYFNFKGIKEWRKKNVGCS